MAHHAPFHFDVASALVAQLVSAFNGLTLAKLTHANVAALPKNKGVYELHYRGDLVYVGKAETGLQKRLGEHLFKLSGRTRISMASLEFRCLTVPPSWITFAPEGLLIEHHKALHACTWNTLGLGSHDQGNRRDTQKPSPWDTMYPINSHWPCSSVKHGVVGILPALRAMKNELPYILRFEKSHADYIGATITVPKTGTPARNLLKLMVSAMPGWQATEFPGYLTLYKGHVAYTWGTVI